MVDIMFGEFQKKLLRIGTNMVLKKMGTSTQLIDYDIEGSTNKVVKALDKILMAGANNFKAGYQSRMVKNYGRLGLWIMVKDTAYRDFFFWSLYNLLKNADKILPLIEPYVKKPAEWYPNVWVDAKGKTQQLKDEGRIPDYEMSIVEKLFVPKKGQKNK